MPGVKNTGHAYLLELFTVVSALFTEYQNSTPFQRYDQFDFGGLDFYRVNIRVTFGDFFTIFA